MLQRSLTIAVTIAMFAACVVCSARGTQAPSTASTDSQVAVEAAGPAEILARSQAALAAGGTMRLQLGLEVWYPVHYTSEITALVSPSGDERAEIKTMIKSDTLKSLEVISGGVFWLEQDTVQGKLVMKVDINEVKKALAAEKKEFAPLPSQGTAGLFDLAGLSSIIDFKEVKEVSLAGRNALAVSGVLASKFAQGAVALPVGAARFYKSAVIYVDKANSLPLRIELGEENGKPLLRLDFVKIEQNVLAPEGVFTYSVPADADVVDRTSAALSEFSGK